MNYEIKDDRKLAREPLTPLKWVLIPPGLKSP